MSFSSEDIANMDREVEDIFNESESEGEPDNKVSEQHKMGRSQVQNLDTADESSSSSADTWSVENSTDTGRFGQWKMARSTAGCYSECCMFSQILSEQGSIMFLRFNYHFIVLCLHKFWRHKILPFVLKSFMNYTWEPHLVL